MHRDLELHVLRVPAEYDRVCLARGGHTSCRSSSRRSPSNARARNRYAGIQSETRKRMAHRVRRQTQVKTGSLHGRPPNSTAEVVKVIDFSVGLRKRSDPGPERTVSASAETALAVKGTSRRNRSVFPTSLVSPPTHTRRHADQGTTVDVGFLERDPLFRSQSSFDSEDRYRSDRGPSSCASASTSTTDPKNGISRRGGPGFGPTATGRVSADKTPSNGRVQDLPNARMMAWRYPDGSVACHSAISKAMPSRSRKRRVAESLDHCRITTPP